MLATESCQFQNKSIVSLKSSCCKSIQVCFVDHLCHAQLLIFISFKAFQTEGKLYLILDFLRGGDVFTRLSKEVSTYNIILTQSYRSFL